MQAIVLASGNAGKLRELQNLLAGLSLTLRTQAEFSVPEVEETGLSFAENALIKARHAAQYTNLPALADDSGLVVDALSGAPGIYSARFAGPNATEQANRVKLLTEMEAVPKPKRSARFHCALVYLRDPDDPMPLICQASWPGTIAMAVRGEHGFGYDSLFVPAGMNCTAAELAPDEKQRLSHRAQALQQLHDALSQETRGQSNAQ